MRHKKRYSVKLQKNKKCKYCDRPVKTKKRGGGCGCGSSHGAPTTNALLALGGDKMQPLNMYRNDPNYLVINENATGNFIKASGGGKRKPPSKRNAKTHTRTAKKSGLRRSGVLLKDNVKGRRIRGGGVASDMISGIQTILPSTLVGASDYSSGGNGLINSVPYSTVTVENPLPKP